MPGARRRHPGGPLPQGDDIAREDYRVEARIGLQEIPCRPAIVTLRLGRVSHLDVLVPRQVEPLGGTPQRPYEEIGRIKTEPGAFPQYGFDVQTGGVYYEVSGVAVRY